MADQFIRPVFQRVHFDNPPLVQTAVKSSSTNDTTTLTVQPGVGVTWQLLYAKITYVAGNNTLGLAKIYYYDGTQNVVIEEGDGVLGTVGESISVASFGNGPIKITNTNYIVLEYVHNNGGGNSATVHLLALVEPI